MKNLLNLLVILFLVSFSSCNEEKELSEIEETNVELSSAANELGTQLGLTIEVESVNISYGVNKKVKGFVNSLKSTSTAEWDVDNSTTIEFVTSTGETLTSIAVPLLSNPNTMSCLVESNGKTKAYVLDFIFDEENKTMSYFINDEITPLELKGFSDWFECMNGVMDSEVGVIITVAGVAGGLGCVPCAGVAGFYTGVAALGCLG